MHKVYSAAAEDRLLHNPTMEVQSFGIISVRIRSATMEKTTMVSVCAVSQTPPVLYHPHVL